MWCDDRKLWGPLPERTPLSAAPLVLVLGVSLAVPGWSGGSRPRPG